MLIVITISFKALFCGVAQTPDYGITILHFPLEESFRHSFGTSIIILHFPLEESFRHSFGTSIIILHFSARGIFQTLVWHQYYYSAFFRSRSLSDTRFAPVLLFCLFPLEESFSPSFGPCFIILHFSARGVFQTLVWHQYYYSAFSARGVFQTLAWHPVFITSMSDRTG